MRGLTDLEREMMEACGRPCHATTVSDCRSMTDAEQAATNRLVAVGRMTLYVPCLSCGAGHPRPTTAGKLALELDTIVRSGKVEV